MGILTYLAQSSDTSLFDDQPYTYTSTSTATLSPEAAIIIVLVSLVFAVAIYAVSAYLLSRIFKKAGVEQWIAWVPVYNSWKLLELGGQKGFWAVLTFIPLVNIASAVFMYIAMYHIGKKLQKEDWFVVLAIFVPIVWIIWLAFDDSKWQGISDSTNGTPAFQPAASATATDDNGQPKPPLVQ